MITISLTMRCHPMSLSLSRRILSLSLAALGLAYSAGAMAQTIFDDLTVASLTAVEKDMLLNELFNDLNKDDDDQQPHVWDNGGHGGVLVKMSYHFSNSAMTEHSLKAHLCRDLKLVVTAAGKTQDLSRRTCSQDSGRWDIQGKDAAPVVYPPFLSDVSVASLTAGERQSLIDAAENVLRDNPDGVATPWSSPDPSRALKASLAPSDTGTKPGSYNTCRDLTMVLESKGKTQTLTRRSCEGRTRRFDIVPGYENGQ